MLSTRELGHLYVGTLCLSSTSTDLFSPMSYLVNWGVLKCHSEDRAHKILYLHYLAKPIDRIIQAISMPIFTMIDHFRDIAKDPYGLQPAFFSYRSQAIRLPIKALKMLATPISLPIKVVLSFPKSIFKTLDSVIQLFIPYQTSAAVNHRGESALLYFDTRETLKKQFPDAIDLLPKIDPMAPPESGSLIQTMESYRAEQDWWEHENDAFKKEGISLYDEMCALDGQNLNNDEKEMKKEAVQQKWKVLIDNVKQHSQKQSELMKPPGIFMRQFFYG